MDDFLSLLYSCTLTTPVHSTRLARESRRTNERHGSLAPSSSPRAQLLFFPLYISLVPTGIGQDGKRSLSSRRGLQAAPQLPFLLARSHLRRIGPSRSWTSFLAARFVRLLPNPAALRGLLQGRMSQATNRDSTGSSASRASNGRLTPSRPLSISVPLASPFLLSSASRPPSSLSTEQWGDGAAYSGESEEEHELGEHEESASGWEDDGEEEEGSEHLEREGLLGRNVRSERLYFSPEDDEDDETDAPTTPVTLPTTSSSPSSMPQPYFDGGEVESPRISFPSSDEGMSIGPSGLSLAERLRLAEVGEAEGSGRWEGRRMQLEEEGWKRQSEEFLRADVEAGTNADEEQPPFATFQESPRILPAVDGDDGDLTYRLDRDLPLPPSDSRPATPASASMHSPRTSAISSSSSSNSSTLSLPSEPPVDLTLPNLPNRPGGTFMSVASGPLAQLASDGGSARSQVRAPPPPSSAGIADTDEFVSRRRGDLAPSSPTSSVAPQDIVRRTSPPR